MTDKVWKPLELIGTTADFFKEKGVPDARLDAELLLAEVLGCKRMNLYTDFERPLTKPEVDRYRELVRRRGKREPVSRILGKREFMGLEFKVTGEVLSPRPETEILVEEAIKLVRAKEAERKDTEMAEIPVAVLDLGTGSGCIALSVASQCPDARIVASDISFGALLVARQNAEKLELWHRIDFREGDLFAVCWEGEHYDLILSNPPYLRPGDKEIWPEVLEYDPDVALYGGDDGLEYYRMILAEAELFLKPGGVMLLEIGAEQAEAVTAMMREHTLLDNIRTLCDHAGRDRIVAAVKPTLDEDCVAESRNTTNEEPGHNDV